MVFRISGKSHSGPLPALTDKEKNLSREMREYIETLASEIGSRHVGRKIDELKRSADYICDQFDSMGYEVDRRPYEVDGETCENLVVEIPGGEKKDEVVVVGGHYDSIPGCPAANDNGTGVAATLALARLFHGKTPSRTVRWVAFVNEEPPYFQTDLMGSRVYARHCREQGDEVVAMLSLETMGCYYRDKGTQQYPWPLSMFYPSTGDFIAFVGNWKSRKLVKDLVRTFRRHVKFPSEGAALPGLIPGVGWSDHWSFWQEEYPAVMVTDTAPFRYPHYHTAKDTVDKVQFDDLTRVVAGLERVLDDYLNR